MQSGGGVNLVRALNLTSYREFNTQIKIVLNMSTIDNENVSRH